MLRNENLKIAEPDESEGKRILDIIKENDLENICFGKCGDRLPVAISKALTFKGLNKEFCLKICKSGNEIKSFVLFEELNNESIFIKFLFSMQGVGEILIKRLKYKYVFAQILRDDKLTEKRRETFLKWGAVLGQKELDEIKSEALVGCDKDLRFDVAAKLY